MYPLPEFCDEILHRNSLKDADTLGQQWVPHYSYEWQSQRTVLFRRAWFAYCWEYLVDTLHKQRCILFQIQIFYDVFQLRCTTQESLMGGEMILGCILAYDSLSLTKRCSVNLWDSWFLRSELDPRIFVYIHPVTACGTTEPLLSSPMMELHVAPWSQRHGDWEVPFRSKSFTV